MERRTVGNVEIVALVDNVMAWPASAVYPAAGDRLAKHASRLGPGGEVALNFGCFVVSEGSARILVDTGWGPEFNGRLLDQLQASGIDRESITAVIFTHLHGDHTGWNTYRATGQPVFPNARYLVPKKDWDHYSANHADSFVRDVVPLQTLGVMDLLDGEKSLAPGVTAVPTPGHTPGHTSIAIASGGQYGCILGDVVISEVDAIDHDLANSFDWDSGIALATRRSLVEKLIEQQALVGASHLPAPGLGRFTKAGWVA